MTNHLMRRIGTLSDGRQSVLFSCRPQYSTLCVFMVFWYPRVEDTIDSEDYF